jgi:NhaP-type Na+/H+ or K+/H+ antiporter
MYLTLTLLCGLVLIYSLASRRIESWPVNGALVFTLFGLTFGQQGLGWLGLEANEEGLSLVAELTLAVVLFSDAANVNMRVLLKNLRLPKRLLLVGLPLTILLGIATGYALFAGIGLVSIALLATMLAPTDAALGKAVITNESVPEKIRESLNVESGLNDGICVPILFILLALATEGAGDVGTASLALTLITQSIGIGLAIGLTVSFLGAYLLRFSQLHNLLGSAWAHLPVVALSILAFSLAQELGGSGFIAAFCGGMLFGHLEEPRKDVLLEESENIGNLLSLLTWVFFGACYVGQALPYITPAIVLYSLLSLTIVRMLPVFICLSGSGLTTKEKLFAGWFGPRGLASVVFGVIVFEAHLPAGEIIAACLVCTVTLSVLLHGLSANPLIKRLATSENTNRAAT